MPAIEHSIWSKLEDKLDYDVLDVVNESHQHSVPKDSETHFRVLIVSQCFSTMNRLSRHRLIHGILRAELEGGVHALAIDAWSPSEWEQNGRKPSLSPQCRGGSKLG